MGFCYQHQVLRIYLGSIIRKEREEVRLESGRIGILTEEYTPSTERCRNEAITQSESKIEQEERTLKEIILNRKKYQEIRKMDHNDLQEYIRGVYRSGYEDASREESEKKEAPALDGLEEILKGIRGIGGAKARTICETVREYLQRKESVNDKAGSEISGE